MNQFKESAAELHKDQHPLPTLAARPSDGYHRAALDHQPMHLDHRLITLRRLALGCVVLMLVVTSASAWLRLAQPRPACTDWPGCRSAERPAATKAPKLLGAQPVIEAVRMTHRVAATAVLLLVIAIGVLARASRRAAALRLAMLLLALALGLSVLGIVTPGSRSPVVLLGNLGGGLLMLALSWRLLLLLRHDAAGAHRVQPALVRLAPVVAALWFVQASLGALAGSGQLAGATMVHLVLALLAGSGGLAVAWAARVEGRRIEAVALFAITCLQILLGAIAVDSAAAVSAVLPHNLGAALGIMLLVGLARPLPAAPLHTAA